MSSARDDLPRHWFVTPELLNRCPNLLAVSSYGAGYDTVDVAACTEAGVCVINQAASNAGAVAEHTIGLILGLSKRTVCHHRARWRHDEAALFEALTSGRLGGAGLDVWAVEPGT